MDRYYRYVEERHASVPHRLYFYLTPDGISPTREEDEARWLPIYVATSDGGAGAAALKARGARSLPGAGLADLAALAAVEPVSEVTEPDASPETTQQTLF